MPRIEELQVDSEAIHDYMEQIPSWILRWGISVIFLVLLSLGAISWFVHYPTIVVAEFRLTSENSPKPVVVRADGLLVSLLVKDNDSVQKDSILGLIEASADHHQVLKLGKLLKKLQSIAVTDNFGQLTQFPAEQFQRLGEIQAAYQNFMQSYTQALALFANSYYSKRKAYLMDEFQDLKQNHDQFIGQLELHQRDAELSKKEFEINDKLFRDKVISPLDFQREESKYLNKQLPVKQLEMSVTNNMTSQTQKQKELTELERQAIEQKSQFNQALNSLISEIETWQRRFILRAPVSGTVNFTTVLEENQALRTGTEIMYVGGNSRRYFGEVSIPQANFGKVKAGQRVLIKFQGYPFEEFGAVEGRVATIAQVPTLNNQFFLATITLPNGLETSNRTKITFKTGMIASAEIVTEDLRLAERIFYQIRKVISQR